VTIWLSRTPNEPVFAIASLASLRPSALPPLLRISLTRAGEFHNLSGVARLMAQEIDRQPLGGGYIVERLLEVLCAEAIRSHIETGPHTGWLGASRIPSSAAPLPPSMPSPAQAGRCGGGMVMEQISA
jgi:hypothetical protein